MGRTWEKGQRFIPFGRNARNGQNSTRCGTVTIPVYTPVRDIQAIPAGTERYNNNYMYINLISIIIIKQVFQQIRMV